MRIFIVDIIRNAYIIGFNEATKKTGGETVKKMIQNPDHKIIKEMAVRLLNKMSFTPAELQKVCLELLPIADFHNGLMRPNNKPPASVRLELEGVLWVYGTNKKWRKMS